MASILLIDDDDSIRLMASELLKSAGYTVDTAGNGQEGLNIYEKNFYDLVITDIVMPDMSGLELIVLLSKARLRSRIIAMSGGSLFSMPVYLPVAKELGVERILAKPIEAAVLLRTVADVLAIPVLQREEKA